MRTRRASRDVPVALLAAGVLGLAGAASLAAPASPATPPVAASAPTTSVPATATATATAAPTTPAPTTPAPATTGPTATAPTTTAPAPGPTVHLTFDDGPSPRWTRKVLRLLEWHDARATFFFLGRNAEAHPRLARAVAEAGHGIGNHSYRHRDLRRLKKRQVRADLRRSQRAIRRATGVTPSCLRPPYGSTNRKVRTQARGLGLRTQLWDVDPRDWDRRPAGRISRSTLRNVRDGSVVLLHDSGGDRRRTLRALPRILTELSARGFTFAGLCR